jgi:serine/threonine-protein kinase
MASSQPDGAITDRNLLFGVLALQADYLDPSRFAEACSAWASRKETPLSQLLVERGWLSADEVAEVDRFLARKLKKHAGDANASLTEVATEQVRQSLTDINDPDIHKSMVATSSIYGRVSGGTVDYIPEGRERYTLTRLHATGGMGRVWLARDAAVGRDVAVKELLPNRADNAAVRARFLLEARITGQLEHPGVVPIYEVGLHGEDRPPYYSMRFVRGRTLAEAAARYHQRRQRGEGSQLELRELLTAFVALCNTVAYAHSRGVLHRDLKPQNVVLGDYGEVILLDWGLARLVEAPEASSDRVPAPVEPPRDLAATMHGQAIGTPAYMAPEQAEGQLERLGARTDVYGLGAILYEILTACPPFTGDDTTAILRRVMIDEPELPRVLAPATPRALEAICLKALAKNPTDRYASAKDLALDVQRWLADEPPEAWHEPVWARASRWVRKHRTGVTAALAALVVAVGGLLAVTAVQAESGRQLAVKNRELQDSNARLARARDRAERRVDLALGAVENFRSAVDGNLDVENRPENEGLRKTLLRAPLAFYQKLRDDFRDAEDAGASEGKANLKLADAYFQLAKLSRDLGSQGDALKALDEAVALLEPAARDSSNVDGRERLARVLRARGELQSESQVTIAAALDSFRQARQLLETEVRERPEAVESHLNLAEVLINTGVLQSRTGQADEGLATLQESAAVLEQARRGDPDRIDVALRLAESRRQTASILRQNKGRLPEALAAVKSVLEIVEPLARQHPDDEHCQQGLASAYEAFSQVCRETGETDKELDYCNKQVAVAEKLARARPTVSRYRFNLVSANARKGRTLGDVGRNAEALATLQSAREGAEALVREHPTNASYKDALCTAYGGIVANLYATGRLAEALTTLEASVAVREQLVRLEPGDIRRQRELAGLYYNCGLVSSTLARPDPALKWYERSLELRQRLAREHPDDPRFAFDVASTVVNMGGIYYNRHELDRARTNYEHAVDVLQKLSASHPENHAYESYLARAQSNVAAVQSDQGESEAAIKGVSACIVIFERLLRAQPDVVQNQEDFADVTKQLGNILSSAGRPKEALPAYQRAIEMREKMLKANKDDVECRGSFIAALHSRGSALEQTESPADAARDYRRAIELGREAKEPKPDMLFELAGCHARLSALAGMTGSGVSASEGTAEADKTISVLQSALNGGFSDAQKLRTNTDFDALRKREDFQKLTQAVEEKSKAKGN